MSIILIPLFVAVIGLVVYFASNGKPSSAGLWAFGVGLLVTLLDVAHASVRLP